MCLRKQAVNWKKSVIWTAQSLPVYWQKRKAAAPVLQLQLSLLNSVGCVISSNHKVFSFLPTSMQLQQIHMVKEVHATLWCCGHQMYHICSGPQMEISLQILVRLRSAVTEVVTLHTHPCVLPAPSTLRSTSPKSPGWKPVWSKQVRTWQEYCQGPSQTSHRHPHPENISSNYGTHH